MKLFSIVLASALVAFTVAAPAVTADANADAAIIPNEVDTAIILNEADTAKRPDGCKWCDQQYDKCDEECRGMWWSVNPYCYKECQCLVAGKTMRHGFKYCKEYCGFTC